MNEKRHKYQGHNINTENNGKEEIKTRKYRAINNLKNNVNSNSYEKPIEIDLTLNKQNTNYYSTKLSIDTTQNYRRRGQEVKIEKDIQPNWKRYKTKTEKETPKEGNVNYSYNNIYNSKYTKEVKNDKNQTNTANNIGFKSIVVTNKKRNKIEDNIVKKDDNAVNNKKNNSSNQIEDNKNNFRNYRISSNKNNELVPQRKTKEEAKEYNNKKPIETSFKFYSRNLKLDESQPKKDDEPKNKIDNNATSSNSKRTYNKKDNTNNKDQISYKQYNNITNNNSKNNIKNQNNIDNNKSNDIRNNKDSKNNIENNIINNINSCGEKDNIDDKNNKNYEGENNNVNNKDNININNKYNITKNESCIINKIKSAYILKNIFNYINDDDFLYKLINYSKLLQEKLKITINNYKNQYLIKKKILLEENPTENDFKKKISKDTIYIDNLDDNKKLYIDFFGKTKSNYLSLYYKFKSFNCINSLKELNLDFSKILKISLIYWEDEKNEGNIQILFRSLFSINNLENNLLYLKIFLKYDKEYIVPNDLFEKINNFKSLRYLYLKNVNFSKPPTIKIKNLKIFYCDLCNDVKIKDCENLQKLIYNSNNLSNIYNLLGDANSTKLEVLDLFNNKISDIKILEKIKFDNLKILDLSMNYISDINCLENDNFKNLKILNLHNNDIKDINILEKAKFEKLEELYLGRNNISNIDVLCKVNFKDLKILNLSWNNISRINALEKVKFEKLEILNLSENKIKDNVTKSKELLLSVAAISDSKLLDLKGTEFSEYKIKIKRNIS